MESKTPVPGEPRIEIRQELGAGEHRRSMAHDVRRGLGSRPKTLPPKYFYDARGSRLFEAITRLPEYYLTDAERSILEAEGDRIVEQAGAEALVEYGSGSAGKTELLLRAMHRAGRLRGYAPIDVSPDPVREVAEALTDRYGDLRVVGIIADFESRIDLPFAGLRRLVLFLGSTIGNFRRAEAVAFLHRVGDQLAAEDAFLVGFDLVKDRATLEAAYNDGAGVTAEFNLNVLRVLNRELDGDFDLDAFRHRAIWDPGEARIEMHLVSLRDQVATLEALDMEVRMEEGETIRTELSHKYTRESAADLLQAAGLRLERWITDREERFALGLARRGGG